MRVIVIGAGRGRRLMPTTADAPKCFAEQYASADGLAVLGMTLKMRLMGGDRNEK
jgi:hypothetical protein